MSLQRKTLGVIPARGGSKRVPRKNLRLLRGKPLIQYTIEAASKAQSLTDWVVSTDDDEIARVAMELGALVIDQPMASDTSTSGDVCRYALDVMEDRHGLFDIVVCLHPTSPIRDPAHIDDAVDRLWRSQLNTAASVVQLPHKTHQNIKFIHAGRLVDATDWSPCHMLNASIYAMKRNWFVKTNSHTDRVSIPIVMDRFHSLDIDEEMDLQIAELYLNAQLSA